MNKESIAIVSPNNPGITETFIKAHMAALTMPDLCFYGGLIPTRAGDAPIQNSLLRAFRKLIGITLNDKTYHDRKAFQNYLIEKEVAVVLAEYGIIGAHIHKACAEVNLPLVVHFHGYDASKYKVRKEYSDAYRSMFDYASAIISVSHEMTNLLVTAGCPENKIVYNPYGPNPDFFNIRPNNRMSLNFCSVGRFTQKKSPLSTIRAIKNVIDHYPKAHLNMIGDGELLSDAIRLVEELDLDQNITFLGARSKDEIMELFANSFCFVQHSVRAKSGDMEGSPVAIMEAAASGLPIVSTRHAGIPETVIDNKTGYLVEEHDVEGMAVKMMELIKNPERAQLMGQAGRTHIQENFSIEKHLRILKTTLYEAFPK